MATPLYPTFRKHIDDATEQLIQRQVIPWVFLTADPQFRVKKFDGREIVFGGVGFEGSPRDIFWARYIDPFLEAIAIGEISAAVSVAQERGVDAKQLLPEVQGILIAAVKRTFSKMAEIDQRLLGRGYPDRIPLRSVDGEVKRLTEFIEECVRCELALWKPKSGFEQLYERNKFWVWLVGTVFTVAGLCVKLL